MALRSRKATARSDFVRLDERCRAGCRKLWCDLAAAGRGAKRWRFSRDTERPCWKSLTRIPAGARTATSYRRRLPGTAGGDLPGGGAERTEQRATERRRPGMRRRKTKKGVRLHGGLLFDTRGGDAFYVEKEAPRSGRSGELSSALHRSAPCGRRPSEQLLHGVVTFDIAGL